MLTKLRERHKVKAHCYWPLEGNEETFGDVTVIGKSSKVFENYVIRKFTLTSDEKQREIYHLQYTDWPDFGVPSSSDAFIEVVDVIEKYSEKLQLKRSKKYAHLLCHCSAGIGRCGTLLAIYFAIQQIKDGLQIGKLSVPDIVSALREQRMGMIQTEEQYLFVYKVLADYVQFTTRPKKRELRKTTLPATNLKIRTLRNIKGHNATPLKPKKALSQTWQINSSDCKLLV